MLQRLTAPGPEPETEGGYFGKLPSEGDFVSGRLPRAFRERLDDWLQRSLQASRVRLGDAWTPAFDAMPVWCFVLGPETLETAPAIGVMGPSRDRVGRRFPLIVVSRLASWRDPVRALCDADGWFAAAAGAIEAARDQRNAFERLDAATRHLPALGIPPLQRKPASDPDEGRSLWWSLNRGDAARRFAAAGLPAPEEFHRMLGRADEAQPTATVVQTPQAMPSRVEPRLVIVATAASHAGTRWRINADAVSRTDRTDLLAVADGTGDGMEAAEAARTAIDQLARVPEAATLDELTQLAKGALGRANTLSRSRGADGGEPASAAVAVLLSGNGRAAAIWAGDARVYLLRDGLMRALTRDHAEAGLRRRLTRGVGAAPQFQPDVAFETMRPGDRFLLATRPLVDALGERTVAETLLDARAGACRLVEDALIAGAAENISAVVADVAAGTLP